MGAQAVLNDLQLLLQDQTAALVRGDHEALLQGAARHEDLLKQLESAEMDLTPEELRERAERIEREKQKLQVLLTEEAGRADFLLRILLGPGETRQGGYPGGARPEGKPRLINRRA